MTQHCHLWIYVLALPLSQSSLVASAARGKRGQWPKNNGTTVAVYENRESAEPENAPHSTKSPTDVRVRDIIRVSRIIISTQNCKLLVLNVPLAQWIARWTSNPKVLGSTPRWDAWQINFEHLFFSLMPIYHGNLAMFVNFNSSHP